MDISDITSDSKKLECTFCGKQCKDLRGLSKHSTVHSGGHLLVCNICEKQFHTRTRHMYSHCDKAVTCEECGVKVPDNRSLANHRACHHTVLLPDVGLTAKLFPCYSCNKMFSSRSSQQIHMRIHTGEKPYSCRYCIKAFADGGTLRKHERIHTGEKPYVCPICDKAFNQRVVLREHIKVHHSGNSCNNYLCQVCNQEFDSASGLCSHLVKHSDDNTAKQRVPVKRPRKYKKWKIKEIKDDTEISKDILIEKSCIEGSIFQNVKLCDNNFDNVQLYAGKSNELIDHDENMFAIDVNYQFMNPFLDELSETYNGTEESISNGCLSLIEISADRNIRNITSDYDNGKGEFWFNLKEKYEFSLNSDECVHSGLGLGATVEL